MDSSGSDNRHRRLHTEEQQGIGPMVYHLPIFVSNIIIILHASCSTGELT